jgi:hypothetical protein
MKHTGIAILMLAAFLATDAFSQATDYPPKQDQDKDRRDARIMNWGSTEFDDEVDGVSIKVWIVEDPTHKPLGEAGGTNGGGTIQAVANHTATAGNTGGNHSHRIKVTMEDEDMEDKDANDGDMEDRDDKNPPLTGRNETGMTTNETGQTGMTGSGKVEVTCISPSGKTNTTTLEKTTDGYQGGLMLEKGEHKFKVVVTPADGKKRTAEFKYTV